MRLRVLSQLVQMLLGEIRRNILLVFKPLQIRLVSRGQLLREQREEQRLQRLQQRRHMFALRFRLLSLLEQLLGEKV